jgi:hypothetical protein
MSLKVSSKSAANIEIDKSFFLELVQLETKALKKNFELQIVNQIMEFYARCIEHYDSIQDPIKVYFLEKLQILIASNQISDLKKERSNF